MTKKSSPDVLLLLKKPFGTLVPDSKVNEDTIKKMIKGARKVIAVGDATTERIIGFGITPDIAVIDGRERRAKRAYSVVYDAKQVKCTNPAGIISAQAVKTINEALKFTEPVLINVDGEEDLLALPLFAKAPYGSVVLYGQPLEGMVIVKINSARRKRASDLIKRIIGSA
ncbi:MAG TPA: GTP-dependent dephospho-CoA kinase family protein [Nitrososphaera sp.]|jgi:hypothetical protein